MCGVVAVIGKQNASELVIEGLKKLEYRGYDSAGIASVSNETLHTIKSEGKLINLIDKLNEVSQFKFTICYCNSYGSYKVGYTW